MGSSFGQVVLDGSLWAAVPLAALAGLISFASPCVLPLVPGYLGYVTGLTGSDLQQRRRGRMLAGTGLFVLGFSFVFVLMSVLLAQVGAAPWLRGQTWITVVLGLLVILMGVVFMGGIPWFQRDRKIHARPPAGLWGAPVLGMTFGLGWAPCIGPTFAAVQALVYVQGPTSAKAILLTTVYCLGLGCRSCSSPWASAAPRRPSGCSSGTAGACRSPGARCSSSSGCSWPPGCGAR
ncbi:Thiol:disulfide interchange protein [Rothia kristinae]|nr:Thiol:disulfide interchange protein [Rothia kristinae]